MLLVSLGRESLGALVRHVQLWGPVGCDWLASTGGFHPSKQWTNKLWHQLRTPFHTIEAMSRNRHPSHTS